MHINSVIRVSAIIVMFKATYILYSSQNKAGSHLSAVTFLHDNATAIATIVGTGCIVVLVVTVAIALVSRLATRHCFVVGILAFTLSTHVVMC